MDRKGQDMLTLNVGVVVTVFADLFPHRVHKMRRAANETLFFFEPALVEEQSKQSN